MRLTNRYNLPEAIVRGAQKQNEQYDSGKSDITATQVIASPRINALRRRHFKDLESDISDEWYALLGSGVHHLLAMGADANDIVEERMFARVNGWVVSGAADIQTPLKDGTWEISDYKVCPVFVLNKDEGEHVEWQNQLNVLAWLARNVHGRVVSRLRIVAIIRDWQRAMSKADPTYPISPILPIDIPVWSNLKQDEFVFERVRLHQDASMRNELGLDLPDCSRSDRWAEQERWAVKKSGGKRALKVFEDETLAQMFVAEHKVKGLEIEYRTGVNRRCEGNYCKVAEWCNQYAAIKAEKANEDE